MPLRGASPNPVTVLQNPSLTAPAHWLYRPQAVAYGKAMTTITDRPTPVLILGMHRSGTSCLTGCLEEAGLYLGDVNTQAGFNKKGNRENRDIMTLHDTVLARVRAAWDDPPTPHDSGATIDWTDAELDSLRALIAGYPNDRPWGVKDPRTLLVLGGWTQIAQPHFIGTFRHPMEVAASLITRAQTWKQDMPLDKALTLWRVYNQRLLALYAKAPFDILRYDVDATRYKANLNTIAAPDLHHQHSQDPVPENLKTIWEALNAVAL